MVNIKVAVRIRPFSKRELAEKDTTIVWKEDNFVIVTDPRTSDGQYGYDSRQKSRKFAVDFCYDSNDSQETVYGEIGSEVLDSMFDGYNACVLAYGHSASGKTHTMMGPRDDPGLTPRICRGLFDGRPSTPPGHELRFRVVVSFLEIYNEKVRDLLADDESGNFSLRVREHPKLGPYVQDLSQHLVTDRKKLLEHLNVGNGRRSTAATENNIYSSRSHAVFTIEFKQEDDGRFETEKSSKVHLVDLAGSERAKTTQSKARLKEGANINKSLVALGNVISALAGNYESETSIFFKEHYGSKTCQPFVPYRDSVLTWLLKDTLGGNSNTIMIATVSPGSSCLSETINTLRYARRTKRIVNRPIVNEDPKIKIIRQLREEIERLKNLLITSQPVSREDVKVDYSEEVTSSESAIRRWLLRSEATRPTVWEENYFSKETLKRFTPEDRRSDRSDAVEDEDKRRENDDEIRGNREKNIQALIWETERPHGKGNRREAYVRSTSRTRSGTPKAASSGSHACEIDAEKKSDVNGSFIDNLSHDTQFFSDSLESLSSFPLAARCGSSDDSGANASSPVKNREHSPSKAFLDSRTNFEETEETPTMLHRSRPDLIKGISGRSKEGFPSSQSCTEGSNLSQSTSENSLNSSGSPDVQGPDHKSARPTATKKKESQTMMISRKKDRRSEVVEAVTSRLYVSKKKPERDKAEESKSIEKDCDDGGELEELKLCKRARMKLFDLSRKLALTKKFRKTADEDTQTDFQFRTVRVKEKSVLTDERELGSQSGTDSEPGRVTPKDDRQDLIMNQVFVPQSSNCLVKCGKVLLRIDVPETLEKNESGTQTNDERVTYKHANTSPVTFTPEESFSDDSLDSENKPQVCFEGKCKREPGEDIPLRSSWGTLGSDDDDDDDDDGRKSNSDLELRQSPLTESLLRKYFGEGIPGTRKEENLSSENSKTSIESNDGVSTSETSSDDFVFYETSKDLKSVGTVASDRELYTITENSEPSDVGEGLSPVHGQESPPSGPSSTRTWYLREGQEKGGEVVKKANKGLFRKVPNSQLVEERTVKTEMHKPNSSKAGDAFGNFHDSPKEPKISWRDVRFNSPGQHLNFNVLASPGPERSSKSTADTPLFEPSKKDQSTDAMSGSQDSITLVFVGPSEPSASVLFEIIRRELGRGSEASLARKDARNKGVQCDAKPMRSVSVDTALMALSRIAKHQRLDISKSASFDELLLAKPQTVFDQKRLGEVRETGCQCDFESERSKAKSVLKYPDYGEPVEEKPKKSVSWSENPDEERAAHRRQSSILQRQPLEEEYESGGPSAASSEGSLKKRNDRVTCRRPTGDDSSSTEGSLARRVRFSNSEDKSTRLLPENVSSFFKEATQLLKNLNSLSTNLEMSKSRDERPRENRKEQQLEVENEVKLEPSLNATWPRRRRPNGKPPPGTRPSTNPRVLRSPLHSRSESIRSEFAEYLRNRSPFDGTVSERSSSVISAPFGSASFDGQSKSSSFRSVASSEHKHLRSYATATLPRVTWKDEKKLDFGFVSDIESDLEDACRRLELAAEQDQVRQSEFAERFGKESSVGTPEEKHWKGKITAEPVKRRKTGACTDGCTCWLSTEQRNPCKRLWLKTCRSTFELDSFGPGTGHCNQLCMFCRKGNSETYCSSPALNSECHSGRCRLDYYGYCPCSPVRLRYVSSSPRAYMQHLLAIRKRIVGASQTKVPRGFD